MGALRTGWPLCSLVQDKVHSGYSTERDFLYMLARAPGSKKLESPPRCALYKQHDATCVLAVDAWARENGLPPVCVDDTHRAWLTREHDRFARRLVRLNDRCTAAGKSLDHADPLDEAGQQMAKRLASLLSPTPGDDSGCA